MDLDLDLVDGHATQVRDGQGRSGKGRVEMEMPQGMARGWLGMQQGGARWRASQRERYQCTRAAGEICFTAKGGVWETDGTVPWMVHGR